MKFGTSNDHDIALRYAKWQKKNPLNFNVIPLVSFGAFYTDLILTPI